jgi:hypothetical protein
LETETEAAPELWKQDREVWPLMLAAIIVAAAILGAGWLSRRESAVSFATEYQAVLLSNGQVYYGRLQGYGTAHPVLTEVYYVQSSANPQTHEQANVLLKRGKEWHAPDRTYLNPSQILMVEPVGPNSSVAELIKALKAQN